MKRIAIFGKPGGGKSTLSKQLSIATGIPLHPLDLIEFHPDGSKVNQAEFSAKHNNIICSEQWIIDGVGSPDLFSQRLNAADTLVYIDLPYPRHYWWVVKRFLLSPFKLPEGWPEGSDVFNGTIASIKVLRRCPQYWNQDFLEGLYSSYGDKKIVVIRSTSELKMETVVE